MSAIGAALTLIRCAKANEITTAAAVEAAVEDCNRDQLVDVLRLLFPILAELYASVRHAVNVLDAADERDFQEIVAGFDQGGKRDK